MQKLEANFKESGGIFKEWKIGDLFSLKTPKKKFNANTIKFGTKHPYVVRTSLNNGIRGYLDEDEQFLNNGKTISFGQDTATIFYQEKPYFTGDKIKIMTFLDRELNSNLACYLLSAMRKSFNTFTWGSSSFNEDVLNGVSISLPTTATGKIDFAHMEKYIQLIEDERLDSLKRWLKQNNLADTTLTTEETAALNKFRSGKVKFEEFRIGELLEYIPAPYLGDNPRQDHVSRIKTVEYCVPVICAKRGDNGIMYWSKKGDFTTFRNVLSVIYNGAIAAGLVYAQDEDVGIFTDSYFIRVKEKEIPFTVNLYLKTVIERCIYEKYSRELKAVWKRIEVNTISLPVTAAGKIDYDFMEHFISAQQKIALSSIAKIT